MKRCQAYAQAGADLVLIQSKSKSSDEIEVPAEAWDGPVPLVIMPTAYTYDDHLGQTRPIRHGRGWK